MEHSILLTFTSATEAISAVLSTALASINALRAVRIQCTAFTVLIFTIQLDLVTFSSSWNIYLHPPVVK